MFPLGLPLMEASTPSYQRGAEPKEEMERLSGTSGDPGVRS